MRIWAVIGILLAPVLVVLVAYLTQQNSALLNRPFRLTERLAVPVYAVVVASLLIGFLPVVTIPVVQALRRDLDEDRLSASDLGLSERPVWTAWQEKSIGTD